MAHLVFAGHLASPVWFLVGNGAMGYGDYYWVLYRDYYRDLFPHSLPGHQTQEMGCRCVLRSPRDPFKGALKIPLKGKPRRQNCSDFQSRALGLPVSRHAMSLL